MCMIGSKVMTILTTFCLKKLKASNLGRGCLSGQQTGVWRCALGFFFIESFWSESLKI